jgi:hypothetical protein
MKYLVVLVLIIIFFFIGYFTAIYFQGMRENVHVLEKPLKLVSDSDQGLLPKGTTLYFVEGMSEGFDVYKVYINFKRPLKLKRTEKTWYRAPIWANDIDSENEAIITPTNQKIDKLQEK